MNGLDNKLATLLVFLCAVMRSRTGLVLLAAAWLTSALAVSGDAQVQWHWSWGTEGGFFVTDGSLVNRKAPAGKYNVLDFAVTRSIYVGHTGAMSSRYYNEGTQPGTGLVWDGSKDTQWFRAGGQYTNGANYYAPTVPCFYLFAVGLYAAGRSSTTLATSKSITLIPGPYASLQLSGRPVPDGSVTFDLQVKDDAGKTYQVGSSLGTGLILIDKRHLNLAPDALLVTSVSGLLPTVFVNYANRLDANGRAQAQLNIPNVAALTGVPIHTAFVTLDPTASAGISAISETASFQIQ